MKTNDFLIKKLDIFHINLGVDPAHPFVFFKMIASAEWLAGFDFAEMIALMKGDGRKRFVPMFGLHQLEL